jgi:hypothetical protein
VSTVKVLGVILIPHRVGIGLPGAFGAVGAAAGLICGASLEWFAARRGKDTPWTEAFVAAAANVAGFVVGLGVIGVVAGLVALKVSTNVIDVNPKDYDALTGATAVGSFAGFACGFVWVVVNRWIRPLPRNLFAQSVRRGAAFTVLAALLVAVVTGS